MSAGAEQLILIDTSVLVNFLRADLIKALASLPGFTFQVTDHVAHEIRRKEDLLTARMREALHHRWIVEVAVDAPEELVLFSRFQERLGRGESAALAAAVWRGITVAIDDQQARKIALSLGCVLTFTDTMELMLSLIRHGVLTIAEADAIKAEWAAKHRFRLKFNSFGDLLN